MESFGNFFDQEWSCLSKMFTGDQGGSDHLAKQQGLMPSQYDLGLSFEILPNLFLHANDESNNTDSFVVDDDHLVNVSDNINPNFYHFFAHENSISCSGATNHTISRSYPYNECFTFPPSSNVPSSSKDVCDQSIEFYTMDDINNSSLPLTQVFSNESLYMAHDAIVEKSRMANYLVSGRETPLKRKSEMSDLHDAMDDEFINEKTDNNPKKRIRVSKENKNKKNMQRKKNTKMHDTENENNNNNGEKNRQSSSSCSSNGDVNGSQDLNGANDHSAEKTRASRGTATDPQSLYARKRRERINERLRILQNLVPNGTKVDISTMLEEAVEYVKFLKLQIQMLSSDDTWMYAPIAYNGMDMGLYQNFKSTL